MYTGYENGYDHLGKQSLLLPVQWTSDGWPRIVPGIEPTHILPMPAGENVGHGMPLSDDFKGSELGVQWMYAPGLIEGDDFRVDRGILRIKAAGQLVTEAPALSVMPLNHAYEVTAEIVVSGQAEGGVLLWSGDANEEWAATGLKQGEIFAKWPRVANHEEWSGDSAVVRIRNDRGDVSCEYSKEGDSWIRFPNATAVSRGRRIALYASGKGEIGFRNFCYRGLD